MKFFRLRNWEKFQHYSKPRPAWLKLYTSINDMGNDWRGLKDHELGQLVRMKAHAAHNDNSLPFNPDLIQELLGLDRPVDLERFRKLGVIEVFASRSDCMSREKSRVLSREKSRLPSSEIRVQRSEDRGQSKETKIKSGKPDDLAKKRAEIESKAEEVLQHLRSATGRKFTLTRNIIACIKREKCTVEQCKLVIDFKASKWLGTDMADHLNPTTPFLASHFQAYLDEAGAGSVQSVAAARPVKLDEDGNPMKQWQIDMEAEFDKMQGIEK